MYGVLLWPMVSIFVYTPESTNFYPNKQQGDEYMRCLKDLNK